MPVRLSWRTRMLQVPASGKQTSNTFFCRVPAGSRPLRDWPEYAGIDRNRQYIFYDSIDGNWWDNSWSTW